MERFLDGRINTLPLSMRVGRIRYAMASVGRSSLAIKCADSIIMAAAKRNPSNLIERPWENIYKISNNLICGVSGLTGDGLSLVQDMRNIAIIHEVQHDTPLEVQRLAQNVATIKHAFTIYDLPRPCEVALLCAGWDGLEGYQVYLTDPSGNLTEWKGAIIGKVSRSGMDALATEIDAQLPPTVQEAKGTVIKALCAMLEEKYFEVNYIEMPTEQTTRIESVPTTALEGMIDEYYDVEVDIALKKNESK